MAMHDTNRYGQGAIGIGRLRHGMRTLAGALLLFSTLALTDPLGVAAATVTVTTTADATNPCATSGTGTCSLRDAVTFANNHDSTAIAFNLPNPSTIILTGGTLALTRTTGTGTTITGPGPTALSVDGNCTLTSGVCTSGGATAFSVGISVTASISGLTIQHAFSSYNGGGIGNLGTLTVANCTLNGNRTYSGSNDGGGIWNWSGGTLTVTNSTFVGNIADPTWRRPREPGLIDRDEQHLLRQQHKNQQWRRRRALQLRWDSNRDEQHLLRLTVPHSGGGISNYGGTVTVTNTIIAGNTATTGPDLDSAITSVGHNLLGTAYSGSGITNGLNGDIINNTPLLGTLGSNGGPTPTIPLLTGSPAIGHGDLAVCSNTSGIAPVAGKDQRGVTRPTTLCAIGAFEPLLSAISPAAGGITAGVPVTLTGAGYAAGVTVTIGGVGCTNVQIVNSTTVRCVAGAHVAGVVDVVVTAGSATGTLAGGYTYEVVNALPGVEPSGPTGGAPNALPATRPTGPAGGAPNALPAPRP